VEETEGLAIRRLSIHFTPPAPLIPADSEE
jgi:hypothetical protein